VASLRNYVVRYHADSEFNGAEEVLLEIVRAIARHGSDEDRAAIRRLGADPAMLAALSRGLESALALPEPPAPEEQATPDVHQESVTTEQVGEVMERARARIRPCIQSALRRHPSLAEVAMTMTIDEDGELVALAIDPHDDILNSCLSLSLGQSRFPAASAHRGTLGYTIRIQH
jgi:hypothetical protein